MLWAGATAALLAWAPKADPRAGLTTDLLPADSPFHQAKEAMTRHFPAKSGLSRVAIIFERQDGPLTARDLDGVERLAALILRPREGEATAELLQDVSVRSPRLLAAIGKENPLLSADGRAAIVSLSLPYDQTTRNAVRIVDHVHAVLDGYGLAPGLATAVTDSAGYGRDYLLAVERSHAHAMWVTLAAIVVILLAVFRAPAAALVPLAGIGMAVAVATKLTMLGQGIGLSSGTAERLFMLVLLYGAGVDYSVLLISRYKEYLDAGRPAAEAIARGLDASLGAILASAGTTAAGLSLLCFARFGVFRDIGPTIVLALVVAASASMTLVPAMVAIVGPRVLWYGRPRSTTGAGLRDRIWPAVAKVVTARPGWILLATLAAAAAPVVRAATLTWSYDEQRSLKSWYSAVRGVDMVSRHWSVGQLSPVPVLIVAEAPQPAATWRSACEGIVAALRGVDGVHDVRGLTTPMGLRAAAPANVMAALLGRDKVTSEFLSPDGRAVWFSVSLTTLPQSPTALATAEKVRAAAGEALRQDGLAGEVHLAGVTAHTIDLRDVTQGDFRRAAIGSLAIIGLIVLALLRDVWLSLFMVAATVLGYAATLGLTYWAFAAMGQDGLNWEVQVFLFIVMVAVGQDYNIFFAVRLAQEGVQCGLVEATQRALIHTGRVISSCGIIMAATLGSMMVADVKMLQQLGFALALGMLIDTFVVRPLLLPAFIVLTRRTLARAAGLLRAAGG